MQYKVGEVARLAHVSVRTLHHYHEIGLLVPSGRSESGYRLYAPQDLERLQQVLFYKELGFGLEEIRALVAGPALDRREALTGQRDLLAQRARRLEAMLRLIDKTLAALEGGIQMRQDEMFEVFGDFDPSEYEQEARERWGGAKPTRSRRAALGAIRRTTGRASSLRTTRSAGRSRRSWMRESNPATSGRWTRWSATAC